MWICCTPSPKWDVRKLRDAPPIARSVQKKHASQLPFSCLKLRFSGKYLLSTGLWSVHSEYFPEKILAPPEIAPWIFPLNCCPSHSAGQNKSGTWWGYQTWLGDDPHLWNFWNLLWDLWVLALDQQNERNKTKAEEQVFFSEVMAYREKADTKGPYCS